MLCGKFSTILRKKSLIVWIIATLLTILGVVGLIWGAPKAFHWMREELVTDAETNEAASQWQPPAKRLDSDKFFPRKVGNYRQETIDTRAEIPELFLYGKGRHALYRSGSSQIHVFLYPMTKSQMNDVFRQIDFDFDVKEGSGGFVMRSIPEPGTFSTQAYSHIRSSRMRLQQNHLWFLKHWLLVFRTADVQDREPFVRAYLQATSATR